MIKRVITGRLKALSGIYIGSGESGEATDKLIFRDSFGDIVIPGTAIAGALRTLATRTAPNLGLKNCFAIDRSDSDNVCACPVCMMFGSFNPNDESENVKASNIWVYDAVFMEKKITSIRDSVAIDRETGVSAREMRSKYDYEVLPRGSEFGFRIEIQDDLSSEQESLLVTVLSEWKNGRCYLGGNLSRGLGNMQLEDIEVHNLDLSKVGKLMDFLRKDDLIKVTEKDGKWLNECIENAKKSVKKINGLDGIYSSFAQIEITLEFTGGFILNDVMNANRSGFDFAPKMEDGKFLLPGSSLRGVLRSQAEKIVRSLVTFDVDNSNEFVERYPACNPVANENAPLRSCNNILRFYIKENQIDTQKGINEDHFCLACRLFGSTYLGSRLFVSDGHLTGPKKIKIMDFLAIDRFTGGGKEGSKFNALVLWQPSFKFRIFLENPKEWQLGWLMITLKDLHDGLLSVGSGQNKWFGKAMISDGELKIGVISEEFLPKGFVVNDYHEGIFKVGHLDLKDITMKPEENVEIWVKKFHSELKNLKINIDIINIRNSSTCDTYFRDDIDMVELYPKEVNICAL
ncbi:MAG: RAMP superfamily CRISPR-associated protein [Thermodesulfobacteriota bacterium]|nr:RAMP superfamily CRISPR-associated protein [Thermodesulfobacteriota bacterium]